MNWAKQTARTLRARSEPPSSRALSTWGYEEPSEVKIIPEGSRSKPKTPIGIGPGLCIMLVGNFREFRLDELPRILIPRTPVNRGAGAWRPRLFLLFEQRLLVCQSASAAHTALTSARLSASKTAGLPDTRVCSALMETVTERLPSPLAAANWV
jgi:hypothetical protein